MVLRSNMQYFAAVLDQLLDVADRSTNTPLSLNVNCDIPIFSWLVEYIQGRGPEMIPTNVVSLILSSNFLMMSKLYEEGLVYLRDHLVDVLLTDVNMDCISADTTQALAMTMREDDIAASLLSLVESGNERCANRAFLTTLLRQVVQHRICDDPVSLRWCHQCGYLVDVEALRSVNASVVNEVPCQMLGAGRVGSRGEVLRTHEPTLTVLDNFMVGLQQQAASMAAGSTNVGVLVQGGIGSLGVATSSSTSAAIGGSVGPSTVASSASASSLAAFQNATGGDAVELLFWRLLGCCRVYRCDGCDTAVPLIFMRQHTCNNSSGGIGAAPSSSASSFSAAAMGSSQPWQKCIPSACAAGEENLLKVFATVFPPNLQPIRRPNQAATALGGALLTSPTSNNLPPASIYLAPFFTADESSVMSSGGIGGDSSSNANSLVTGPIMWKRGTSHANQAIQPDGTPNVEIIRFHETKMMTQLQRFINSFATPGQHPPLSSYGAAVGSSGSNVTSNGGAQNGRSSIASRGGLHRSSTFTGGQSGGPVRGRLSSAASLATSSSVSSFGAGGGSAAPTTSANIHRSASLRGAATSTSNRRQQNK
ncbi:Hypothetical protein, putative [Bodo saltans]|uniref:SANT and BTB domain-containing protein n=1 Tax=Bodo saltans TaxID=75058 RepID=A0A0S4JS46_BODSA|nr:Hypothetical protein, putative [Bodo saltans]|eukprot:CUG94345.1 Hypothetical protein, putative [Bodo saltans]